MKPGDNDILRVLESIYNDVTDKHKESIEKGIPDSGLVWAGNLISAYYGSIKDGKSEELIEFVKSGEL